MVNDFESSPCVHIFGQWGNHCEAVIRGNKAGLLSLKNALEAAIATRSGSANVMTNDGEGYEVKIERVNLSSSCGSTPYIQSLALKLASQDLANERKWKKK